jgi:hypothetical protein
VAETRLSADCAARDARARDLLKELLVDQETCQKDKGRAEHFVHQLPARRCAQKALHLAAKDCPTSDAEKTDDAVKQMKALLIDKDAFSERAGDLAKQVTELKRQLAVSENKRL